MGKGQNYKRKESEKKEFFEERKGRNDKEIMWVVDCEGRVGT